ncbi:MAG: hypothetical protein JSU63_05000 [Phycisphaerales bacterium]|nr:MAG: hypothetical protein JSU63_05000 [Phycisphaerales bacterium]
MTDPQAQLEALLDVFARMGTPARKERLGGSGGGLCTIRDQKALFVDLDADTATQVDQTLAALATVPEAEVMYLLPALRERLEKLKGNPEQRGL